MRPTLGRIVIYRTDGRNGLDYDLPAMITVTRDTHPGDYPDGRHNPCPVPSSDTHVHLTVFTPGGYGTTVVTDDGPRGAHDPDDDTEFVGAHSMIPGSGTYVELDVPFNDKHYKVPRTWQWPEIRP
jgi:hypothetical protein